MARTSPTSSSPPVAPGGPRVSWFLTAASSPPLPRGSTPTTSAGLRSGTFRPPALASTFSLATGSAPSLPAELSSLAPALSCLTRQRSPISSNANASTASNSSLPSPTPWRPTSSGKGEVLGNVRLLAVGSDTLRRRLYRRLWRLIGPGGRVVNSYGLTEATIDSTYFDATLEDLQGEDGPVPIGRPFPGMRAYILDGRGEPVPVGVVGELYIGGPGVARGYVANPRQTAERFLPDPHRASGSRMYATGDRARWREDGVIELLGRRDGQVKLRGFRLELAEVEAAVGSWPGIRETAVVTQGDGADGQQLIAFIVGEQDCTIHLDSLRRFLRDRLPRPMIPSQFRIVESLPRTHSGKVDRQRLSQSKRDGVAGSDDLIRPRDEIEEQLAAIWEDLLQVRPIGVTDDFFDLGGHSLLAVRLAARVQETFGHSLALSDLLLGSTIEELAARIREPIATTAGSPLIDLRVSGPGWPLYLVHPIGGGVLCYNSLARCLDGTRAVFGFQAAGLEGEAEPETNLVLMASRYVDALRRSARRAPTFWADGRWGALSPSRWPSNSPRQATTCLWSSSSIVLFRFPGTVPAGSRSSRAWGPSRPIWRGAWAGIPGLRSNASADSIPNRPEMGPSIQHSLVARSPVRSTPSTFAGFTTYSARTGRRSTATRPAHIRGASS